MGGILAKMVFAVKGQVQAHTFQRRNPSSRPNLTLLPDVAQFELELGSN
jgi:plastocyanin domain-containing protein